MEYAFYYIEAYLACFFLLGLVFFKIRRGVNKQLSMVYLGNLVLVLMLYFLAEIFWALVDGWILSSTKSLLFLSNIFTYVLINIASYLWFILSEAVQKDKIIENDMVRLFISIPAWVSSILCVSAYRTGLVFYVDESGNLVNGKFYMLLIAIPFGYLIAASAMAIRRACYKDRYIERDIYLMIGVFPIAPITLGILQAIYWRIPLLCYGCVAAVFYVYITLMDSLVSLDPLTQLNNKSQMYKYLASRMENENPGMSLFILMVDIDNLGDINDTYGRSEGDKALVRTANSIKETCSALRNRFFVSRYGGDEFIIVAQMPYRAEANYLAEQIKTNVRRTSRNSEIGEMTVSIGIAQYDYNSPISMPAFIARADSDLYKQQKTNGI